MKFGFHISISGGLKFVAKRAKELNCDCAQIFSRNPRGWAYSSIKQQDADEFRKEISSSDINPVAIHLPYLPNLASPDKSLFRQSANSLTEELRRAHRLGIPWIVTHIGKAMGESESDALKRVVAAVDESLATAGGKTKILLENTAGQGTEIGYKFEHIAQIIDSVSEKKRIGLCFDTCHAFAAGYDVATEQGLNKTVEEIDSFIGLSKLYFLHLNDAKGKLGSRLDRHWHIGEGFIGKKGFKLIVNHPAIKNLPCVMETPKSDEDDKRNMKTIRSLVKE